MKIISFIEDEQLVKKILKHLDLWAVKRKPPPRANGPPLEAFIIYDESPSPSADDYIIDSDRSTLSFDPEALEGRLSTGYPIEIYL
jgi:hypothetical protein